MAKARNSILQILKWAKSARLPLCLRVKRISYGPWTKKLSYNCNSRAHPARFLSMPRTIRNAGNSIDDVGLWHETDMSSLLRNVRSQGQSGKHVLALSFSGFDPGRVKTFFLPQKLQAAGRDPRGRDRLSIFLLYRVWSQSGRNLEPC